MRTVLYEHCTCFQWLCVKPVSPSLKYGPARSWQDLNVLFHCIRASAVPKSTKLIVFACRPNYSVSRFYFCQLLLRVFRLFLTKAAFKRVYLWQVDYCNAVPARTEQLTFKWKLDLTIEQNYLRVWPSKVIQGQRTWFQIKRHMRHYMSQ